MVTLFQKIEQMTDEVLLSSLKEEVKEATSGAPRNMGGCMGMMGFYLDEIYKRVEKDGLTSHALFETTAKVMARLVSRGAGPAPA